MSTDSPEPSSASLLVDYLAALGLERGSPDAPLLTAVMSRHLGRVPFASLSVRLGDRMPLALPALFERLVVCRRGGYCFEQNRLLQEMLDGLGYATRLVMARVVYDQDIHPGLTHRMMLVSVAGEDHVVDVGFGALGPRVPVPISGTVQMDGWRQFRIAEAQAGVFQLQCLKEGRWFTLYRFDLNRYGESDCELGHFYSHRHPAATFVNHLVVARLLPDRILSLRGLEYQEVYATGEESLAVEGAAALHRLLTGKFGLSLTLAEAERLIAA